MPASFTPDMEITEDDSDDEDKDGEGTVWTLQHQECGARGLVVRASWNFFLTSSDIMNHHKKGIAHCNSLGLFPVQLILFELYSADGW